MFEVRDLMISVLPKTGPVPDDLLMCTMQTTTPKPQPPQDPPPPPKPGKFTPDLAATSVLAQLHEQLNRALHA